MEAWVVLARALAVDLRRSSASLSAETRSTRARKEANVVDTGAAVEARVVPYMHVDRRRDDMHYC